MTKPKSFIEKANEEIAERIAYWINEFIEKRCDRVYLRKRITEETEAFWNKKIGEMVGEIEKVKNHFEGMRGAKKQYHAAEYMKYKILAKLNSILGEGG